MNSDVRPPHGEPPPDGERAPREGRLADDARAPDDTRAPDDLRPPVRVLLADDQRLVRESLGTLLGLLRGIELVGAAADGEEVLQLVAQHRPDVVLMDLRMPRLDGIEATRRLRERDSEVCVIALTTYADDESVLGALRAGARGYLTKDASAEDIRAAIFTVADGDAALDPAVQHHVVAALAGQRPGSSATPASVTAAPSAARAQVIDPAPRAGGGAPELPDDLTPREAEVLQLIAAGLTNTEIAERLVVSPATVKSHINHLFAKTGVRGRAQAVNYAYRSGIAQPPR